METIPRDFNLAVHISPGDTYEWSELLLARAHLDGTLELLTAAWGRMLGYGRYEFSGKTLGHLMSSGERLAPTVAAILDHANLDPVDLTLRCRRGETKALRLHRRYDAHTPQMFIFAEEVVAKEVHARRARVGALRRR
jgi:hypothetical protein